MNLIQRDLSLEKDQLKNSKGLKEKVQTDFITKAG